MSLFKIEKSIDATAKDAHIGAENICSKIEKHNGEALRCYTRIWRTSDLQEDKNTTPWTKKVYYKILKGKKTTEYKEYWNVC